MKSKLYLSLILSFSFYLLSSQVPQGFNYQAIARDVSNNVIANQSMPARITLQTTLSGGITLYQETHAVTTNQFGLMTFVVGNGTPVSGTFSTINWQAQTVFIKTEIQYPGPGYTDMGTSQLRSVPYSMLAKDLEGPLKKLGVTGTTTNLEEALFEVKNNIGQTIFAVYNEGVRVFVDDGAKGSKGGFAIGGFGTAKAPSQEYLRVTRDSTRVYVNPLAKGSKGGFAIGGFSATKATIENFMDLTDQNYFIGHNSGKSITTGVHNSFIGYQSGMANTTGQHNSFMGYNAGMANTTGNNNVFIGNNSGVANTGGFGNVFIGDNAGVTSTTGNQNVFLGKESGYSNVFGGNNVYIGYQAGFTSPYGSQNICIGNYAGYYNTSSQNLFIGEFAGQLNTTGTRNSFVGFFAGQNNLVGGQNSYFGQFAGMDNTESFNTMIGYWAGGLNTAGANNTFLGYRSGQGSSGSNNVFLGYKSGEGNTGANNVLIGYQAGLNSGAKSNTLYIDNSSTSTPLIGGDFTNNRVGINRLPTTYALEVGGTIWANGSAISAGATTWSDARYKKDITPLTNALSDVLLMTGVKYNWKQSDFPDYNFPAGEQIGVIAQDMEKILPELVLTGPDGYKSVSYEKLTPVLIEAIKEQQSLISSQSDKLNSAMKEIDYLKSEIESIKALLKK